MDTAWILAQMFMTYLTIIFVIRLARCFIGRAAHPTQSTTSSRRLGKFEECLKIYSNERQGTTNSCYVTTFHSKEKLKESLVRKALLRLAKRQPMLRAIIKTVSNISWFGRKNESYFEIIEPNKVPQMIDLTTSDLHATEWQKEWYDVVLEPIDTGLQWKAILFKEEYIPDSQDYVNTVIFRVNHCIVDGIAGIKLCKQFLKDLNNVSQDPSKNEDIVSLELLPSFFEIISKTRLRSFYDHLKESLGLNFIYKIVRRIKLQIFFACKSEKPYRFLTIQPSVEVRDLLYKVFSERQTSQICKVCKSKGVTVTAALVAAAHKAFCKLTEGKGSTPPQQEVTHAFAISGLRVCKPRPPVEYLGNYLLTEALSISKNEGDFWLIADKATKQIRTIIVEGRYVSLQLAEFDVFTPSETINELQSPLDPKKKLKLFTGNYISSAGAFTFDDNSTCFYKLHECVYYSLPFGFSSFALHSNVTVNGKMSWVITCNKFVPHTVEKQFARLCFETLLKEIPQE